jgi:hypothetical protein
MRAACCTRLGGTSLLRPDRWRCRRRRLAKAQRYTAPEPLVEAGAAAGAPNSVLCCSLIFAAGAAACRALGAGIARARLRCWSQPSRVVRPRHSRPPPPTRLHARRCARAAGARPCRWAGRCGGARGAGLQDAGAARAPRGGDAGLQEGRDPRGRACSRCSWRRSRALRGRRPAAGLLRRRAAAAAVQAAAGAHRGVQGRADGAGRGCSQGLWQQRRSRQRRLPSRQQGGRGGWRGGAGGLQAADRPASEGLAAKGEAAGPGTCGIMACRCCRLTAASACSRSGSCDVSTPAH